MFNPSLEGKKMSSEDCIDDKHFLAKED